MKPLKYIPTIPILEMLYVFPILYVFDAGLMAGRIRQYPRSTDHSASKSTQLTTATEFT